MKLNILGNASTSPPNYRGVDRHPPFYIEGIEDEHPANRAFFWSTSVNDDGYLHGLDELDKAKKLIDLYARLEPPQFFEVVQVTHDDESIDILGDFLGYDIARFNYSILLECMSYCIGTYEHIRPLMCLIEKHFKPLLNENFLFSRYDHAKECFECMVTLHNLTPETRLLEPDAGEKFKVVGVYSIYKSIPQS